MDEPSDTPEGPAAVAAAHHHPVPQGPPSNALRNITIGVLVFLVVVANAGNIFFATFVNAHPLALIAMNASNRNLALVSNNLAPLSFFLVGFARLFAPDLFFFWIGRWYGDAAIRWMERKAPSYGQLLRQLEGWFDKARFVVVAIAPNNPVCLFAGAAGMGMWPFLIANVVGTIGRLILIRLFSSVFADLLGSIKDFIGTYRWPLTALSLVLVAFTIWNDRRGGRDGIGDLVNLEEGISEAEAELEAEALESE
ncbi:DedA family protein [Aquihabitans sp. McL0605]|uniref:DedA family protein n=1 Tax=Aquihabitans sp. McL0605 TaxID=3415671 RepID=UPI003CEF87E6